VEGEERGEVEGGGGMGREVGEGGGRRGEGGGRKGRVRRCLQPFDLELWQFPFSCRLEREKCRGIILQFLCKFLNKSVWEMYNGALFLLVTFQPVW
jgi:hypothetical protein